MRMSEKICFMILTGISIFLVAIFDVRAENATPNTMEYYNANGDLFSFGGPTQVTSYTIPFYTLYRSYDGLTSIKGMYGQPSGVTGKYFTFYMYSPNNSFRSVSAYIQLSSGDYLSCNIDNSLATNRIYTATCDLSGFGNTFTIYKYGFQWEIDAEYSTPETNTSQYRLSRIFYFDNANSYNAQIATNTNDIKNKLNEDIDNDSKTAPNQQEYDNAKQQENTIISGISGASPNDITFTQDINATGTIWNLIDNIVNTNAKIIGLIISILSIGLIKLILAR